MKMKKHRQDSEYKAIVPFESFEGLKDHKDLKSIASLFPANKGLNLQMTYIDNRNGEIVNHIVTSCEITNKEMSGCFSESTAIQPVMILHHDGEWETGVRWWELKSEVVRENGRLNSYYQLEGTYNEEKNVIEDDCRGSAVPMWIQRHLPLYNERIRRGLEKEDASIQTKNLSLKDFNRIRAAYNTSQGIVDHERIDEVMDLTFEDGSKRKMAVVRYMSCPEPISYSYDSQEFIINTSLQCYTYIKSTYEDVRRAKKVWHIIPTSSLMSFSRRLDNWNSDGFDQEVWNNLDQTVSGNV